jgi:hypothetical protein
VPTRKFNTFGLRWTLNTGPFNVKEHSVITLMAGISINYAYSTNALLALQGEPFYNLKMSWGFQLLFTISSQVIGLGMAGLFRRFLVSLVFFVSRRIQEKTCGSDCSSFMILRSTTVGDCQNNISAGF